MFEQLRDLRDHYGHQVSAVIAKGSGGLVEKLQREGIPFHQFDFSFISSPHRAHTLAIRVIELARLFRRERFDVVQTHLFDSMVMGRLAGWLADVPVRLAMIAGPYHLEAATPRWIDITTCWMESALIPSCNYTQQLYLEAGVGNDRLHVIYYGPDADKFDPAHTQPVGLRQQYHLSDNAPLIGMVSYFYPPLPPGQWTPPILHNRANKRHEDLIAAAPLILKEYPEARILFIGSGWGEAGEQHRQRLIAQVTESGLAEHLLFIGFRADVNNLLVDLDVAVQASVSENLGGTIESLLMEVPTVATCVGGMVDSVRHHETGILVEPLNPTAMAEGILTLLRDPDCAKEYARAGRKWMLERFTLNETVKALDNLYCHLSEHRHGYQNWKSALHAVQAGIIFPYLAIRLAWDISQPQRALVADRARAQRRTYAQRFSSASITAARVMRQIGSRLSSLRRSFAVPLADLPRSLAAQLISILRALAALFGSLLNYTFTGILVPTRRIGHWLSLRPLYFYGYIRHLLRGTVLLRRWDIFFARIRGREPYEQQPPADT